MRVDHPLSPAFLWQVAVSEDVGEFCPVENLLQRAESLNCPNHYEIDLMKETGKLEEPLETYEDEGYKLWVFHSWVFRNRKQTYYECIITDPNGKPVYRRSGPELNEKGEPFETGACLSESKEALANIAFANQRPPWET